MSDTSATTDAESPAGEDVTRRVVDGVAWITSTGRRWQRYDRRHARPNRRVVQDASADLFVRAVVITAAGERAFCTGADLRGGRAAPRPKPTRRRQCDGRRARTIRNGWQRLVGSIIDCEKPVIAGVNGTAPAEACTWRWPATWSLPPKSRSSLRSSSGENCPDAGGAGC